MPTEQKRPTGSRWTIGYYAVLVFIFVVVHQDWLMVDLVGEKNSIWLWKANEAYVVAFVVPLFWDFVATRRKDGTIVPVPGEDVGGRIVRRVVWYGALILILACMEGPMLESIFGSRLPQRILTLRDVFSGLLVLSIYFEWSRGLWRCSGPRLVSGWARLGFWVAVLVANIAIYQDAVKDVLGPDNASTLDFHAEAFAVCLFVPLYFDIVLPLTRGDVPRVRGARVRLGDLVLEAVRIARTVQAARRHDRRRRPGSPTPARGDRVPGPRGWRHRARRRRSRK